MNNTRRVKDLEGIIYNSINNGFHSPSELNDYLNDMAPHVKTNEMADALIDLHMTINKFNENEKENKKGIENKNVNERSSEKRKHLKQIIKWMIKPIIK